MMEKIKLTVLALFYTIVKFWNFFIKLIQILKGQVKRFQDL